MDTIKDTTNIVDQGEALDFMCKKYEKEDLFSIMWVKTDEDGLHHFEIVLRSAKKSKAE
jgi:hypothetical protein